MGNYIDIRPYLNNKVNIIIGQRGCGKTYSLNEELIDDYINNGHKFVYVKNTATELLKGKNLLEILFDNAPNKYNHTIKYAQGKFTIQLEGMEKPEVFGYTASLSTAQQYRGPEWKVLNVVCDDMLTFTNVSQDMVSKLVDLTKTFTREKDGYRIILTSNITWTGTLPLLDYFDIEQPMEIEKGKVYTYGAITVYYVPDEYFGNDNISELDKLIENTQYFQQMVGNNQISEVYFDWVDRDYNYEVETCDYVLLTPIGDYALKYKEGLLSCKRVFDLPPFIQKLAVGKRIFEGSPIPRGEIKNLLTMASSNCMKCYDLTTAKAMSETIIKLSYL